ncbi:MAG: PHP domain-containing protein [Candidatus Hydrogenedentes bacterium]|nr:PHP domain-containing protein [Candidatus Hydrogenedentota bacterium]
MGFVLDLHLHTQRHSRCSRINELRLIDRAIQRGLDGLVITEHHYQWPQAELDELLAQANAPGFVLLSAFEYSSSKGDILVYGLQPEATKEFVPGGEPEKMLAKARAMGAVCIAAHPTRAEISFDERILKMPFDALEIESVNLQPHEQRLAKKLAESLKIPPTGSSDAHRIEDVGAYATEFQGPVLSMADLQAALRHGTFRPAGKR